jgi:general stress protein YciG
MTQQKPKQKRGFAAMDREKMREIARTGGRKAHRLGVAYKFTSEEARAAGSKGGKAAIKRHKFTSDEARAASLQRWQEKAEHE